METRPPRVMEAIAEYLIPWVSREHVLGDLCERYTSPAQFFGDCMTTIPAVVFSRMRRTLNVHQISTEAVLLYASFFVAAWQGGGGFPNFVAPVVTGLLALSLFDAYASRSLPMIRALVGSSVALWIATITHGEMRPWIAAGGFLALLSLLLISVFMRTQGSGSGQGAPPSDMRSKAIAFERTIRWRNLREFAGVLFVIVSSAMGSLNGHTGVFPWAGCVTIAGALYVAVYLYRKGSPRRVPRMEPPAEGYASFYRAELILQRDLLRNVWKWYLGPLVPGLVVVLAGKLTAQDSGPREVAAFAMVATAIFTAVWLLNRYSAQRLQQLIDALSEEVPH